MGNINQIFQPQEQLETAASAHAKADLALIEVATRYDKAINKVDLHYESMLRAAVSKWQATNGALTFLVKSYPEFFEKKKSRSFDGVTFGYRKNKGKMVLPKSIEKLLARMKKVLGILKYKKYVIVEETPSKTLLATLSVKDLKALGIGVIDDVDAPFVKVKSPGAKKVEELIKTVLLGVDEDGE